MTTFTLYKSTRRIGSKLIDISISSEGEQTVRCFLFFTPLLSQLTSLKVLYKLPQHGYETLYEPTPRTNLIRSLAKRSIMI